MKTTTLILMLLLSSQLMAGPQYRFDELGLTEDQKEQMAAVNEQSRERMNVAREDIQNQALEEMAAFLTTEQLAQIKERMQHRLEHGEMRKERRQMKREKRQKKRFREDSKG